MSYPARTITQTFGTIQPSTKILEAESDLTASTLHRPKNNTWVDDSLVSSCYNCASAFGFFLRKHHCRCCGNIFCASCSNNYIQIPEYIYDRPSPEDYWNLSYYARSLRGPEERVCDACRSLIEMRKREFVSFSAMLDNPPSVRGLNTDPLCTADMREQYLQTLRAIQYKLPDDPYTPIELKLLQVNSSLFANHSKYTVHLLKTICWNSQGEELALRVLRNPINCPCRDLWCTRTCQPELSTDDCLHVLHTCRENLPPTIVDILLGIISISPEPVLLCHVPLLVDMLLSTGNTALIKRLVELLLSTNRLFYHSFWAVQIGVSRGNAMTGGASSFYSAINPDVLQHVTTVYRFYAGLVDHLADPIPYLQEQFQMLGPMPLPYAPDTVLVEVQQDSMVIKDSCTRPICLTFYTNTGATINLLFKREDISRDVTVLNLMTLCNIILEDHLEEDFPLIAYPAMCLTPNGGVIEIVRGAQTVYQIAKEGRTILQHIILQNDHLVVRDILQRYMRSLVVYTLQNYYIGLGDRHLQNIMITDDGVIFHIDFGYILGEDAHLGSGQVKINTDMIEAMGGADEQLYRDYLDLCARGTTILRKHYILFHLLLQQSGDAESVTKFIRNRFQPRQSDSDVADSLVSIIRQSSEGYGGYIIDFFHYHTQEKTVQTGFTKLVKTAIGAVASLADMHGGHPTV